MIETKRVQYGGVKIFDMYGFVYDRPADIVRPPDHLDRPCFETARQHTTTAGSRFLQGVLT